jgi:hypothetical protein
VGDTWEGIGPASTTGFSMAADSGSGGVTAGVESAVATRTGNTAPPWSPDNALFWFAVILLASVGAISFSTSVKAGPIKGSASI